MRDAELTDPGALQARVVAVAADEKHAFSKPTRESIRLLAGLGVEGDTHLGVTVQHRSRVAVDPTRPNLRQVHLVHAELAHSDRSDPRSQVLSPRAAPISGEARGCSAPRATRRA